MENTDKPLPSTGGAQSAASPTTSPIVPLDDHQKGVIRASIVEIAKTCLGISYAEGKTQADFDAGVGQWRDLSKLPATLDCEGLVRGCYLKAGLKMPEGSQHQFDFTVATASPKIGDLAFFGHGKNILQIYHVGLVYDDSRIIEARFLQPESNFETGKVILRPRGNWVMFANFCGYRSHPKLI